MCAHGLETRICMHFQVDLAMHCSYKQNLILLMLNLIERLFLLRKKRFYAEELVPVLCLRFEFERLIFVGFSTLLRE
jgi:hypothetical protein